MIKLIIFELDGVLVETEQIYHESLLDATQDITGVSRSKFEKLLIPSNSIGNKNLYMLRDMLALSELDVQLINDKKHQNSLRHLFRELNTSPDQQEMLSTLEEQYTIAVVSNSGKESVITVLNILGITNIFSEIISSDDIDADVNMFDIIMANTKINANETLVVSTTLTKSNASLLEVDGVWDVTLDNILAKIFQ